MSFDIVCPSCAAPSGPSVGICPFCKSVMSDGAGGPPAHPTLVRLRKLYDEGKIEEAVILVGHVPDAKLKPKERAQHALLSAQILLEAEAPSSRVRAVLAKALLDHPEDTELLDYLEITEAKQQFAPIPNDPGEVRLKHLLVRSPENPHALFFLGTHQFWMDNESASAARHLERCVAVRPCFLRAWGCLGMIYKKLGQSALAARAFRKCVALETNPEMKAFFKQQIPA